MTAWDDSRLIPFLRRDYRCFHLRRKTGGIMNLDKAPRGRLASLLAIYTAQPPAHPLRIVNHHSTAEPIAYHDVLLAIHARRASDGLRIGYSVVICTNAEPLNMQFTCFQVRGSGTLFSNQRLDNIPVLTSATLIALINLCNLDLSGKSIDDMGEVLGQVPLATPREKGGRGTVYTSEVWIGQALEKLRNHGFFVCPNLEALEVEYLTVSELLAEGVLEGQQKRVVRRARSAWSVRKD